MTQRIRVALPASAPVAGPDENYCGFARWTGVGGSAVIREVNTAAAFSGQTLSFEVAALHTQDPYILQASAEWSVSVHAFGFLADELIVTPGDHASAWHIEVPPALEDVDGYALIEILGVLGSSLAGGLWSLLLRLVPSDL